MKIGYKKRFFFLYFRHLSRHLKNCKSDHGLHYVSHASLVKILLSLFIGLLIGAQLGTF